MRNTPTSTMPEERRFPNIERHGRGNRGWRATVHVQLPEGGRKLRKGPIRSTQEEAHEDAQRFKAEYAAGKVAPDPKRATLGDAIRNETKRLREDVKVGIRRQDTLEAFECHARILASYFGEDVPLDSISPARIVQFIAAQRREGASGREVGWNTLRKRLSYLGRLFKNESVPDYTKDRSVRLGHVVQPQSDWLPIEQVHEILRSIPAGPDRDLIVSILATGARLAEMGRAKKEHVDTVRRQFHIAEGKRGSRTLPLPAEAIETLNRLAEQSKSAWIIPGRTEKERRYHIANTFRRWAGKLEVEELHPHAARHTLGTWMQRAGITGTTIAACLGHRLGAVSVTARYLSAADDDVAGAFSRWWDALTEPLREDAGAA